MITSRDGVQGVHYEQRTWLVLPGEEREPSHWETGFLLATEDGRIELLNAQESRRVEVLVGRESRCQAPWENYRSCTGNRFARRMRPFGVGAR